MIQPERPPEPESPIANSTASLNTDKGMGGMATTASAAVADASASAEAEKRKLRKKKIKEGALCLTLTSFKITDMCLIFILPIVGVVSIIITVFAYLSFASDVTDFQSIVDAWAVPPVVDMVFSPNRTCPSRYTLYNAPWFGFFSCYFVILYSSNFFLLSYFCVVFLFVQLEHLFFIYYVMLMNQQVWSGAPL